MDTSVPSFTLTNDSIALVWGGRTYNIRRGAPNFSALRGVLIAEKWDEIPNYVTIPKSIQSWAKGAFTVKDGDAFFYKNEKLPDKLSHRIVAMATNGDDPTPLLKFWERLQLNPSFRSVQQTFEFIQHQGIPFTRDGCFLAYKSVRTDYKDHHSGTVDNHPGVVNQMDRNKVSDDPNIDCHYGFHVGAYQYASTFNNSSPKVLVVKVDPADVVCVPFDSGQQKMRVCKYLVLGHCNGKLLPDTIFDEEPEFTELGEYQPHGDVITQLETEAGLKTDEVVEEVNGEGKEQKPEKRIPAKGFAKFAKMGLEDLMKQPLLDLRRFATKGLKIVGASKIPGGKVALVAKILEVME